MSGNNNMGADQVNASLPEWVSHFPILQSTHDPVWTRIASRAKEVVLPKGYEVFHDGDPCENYIMVLKGSTRVYKTFENGRDMLLYRVQAGETCSLTTSILLAGGSYTANALTEEETHAVVVPIHDFHDGFDQSKGFRDYVCMTFGGRIRDFIMLLESIATRNVEVRMARWLLENCDEHSSVVEVSHSVLAFELGTVREVVSRNLKEFQNKQWVNLSRKNIEVLDKAAMEETVKGLR